MKNIIIVVITLLFVSCVYVHNRSDFIGFDDLEIRIAKKIKHNGYYYHLSIKEYSFGDSVKTIQPMMFYKDGYFKYFPHFSGGFTDYKEKFIKYNTYQEAHNIFLTYLDSLNEKNVNEELTGWGKYKIIGDTLELSYYRPGYGIFLLLGNSCLIEKRGLILSDLNILIKERTTNCISTKRETENKIYHFKECLVKPKATTRFKNSMIFRSKWWPPIFFPIF